MPTKKTILKTIKTPKTAKIKKKVTTKKALTDKKSITKIKASSNGKTATKTPVIAEGYTAFWVNNGPILEHLQDLMNALADMDETTFRHHAEGEQNDFTVWVNDVLGEGECASELAKAKTSKSAYNTVKKFVAFYNF